MSLVVGASIGVNHQVPIGMVDRVLASETFKGRQQRSPLRECSRIWMMSLLGGWDFGQGTVLRDLSGLLRFHVLMTYQFGRSSASWFE